MGAIVSDNATVTRSLRLAARMDNPTLYFPAKQIFCHIARPLYNPRRMLREFTIRCGVAVLALFV
ncbi:hypothetical protein KDL45_18940, partial [bacterium]|nr:hypothetical protein [bacterium]